MHQAQQRTKLGRVSEKDPLVLGIESTCDETGVALVRGCDLLVDRTATSMDQYARYGGIIPEIASRAHLESFLPTLESALDEAGVTLNDVDAVAVAAGPGLVGSLTVGICAPNRQAGWFQAHFVALGLVPFFGPRSILGTACPAFRGESCAGSSLRTHSFPVPRALDKR